MYFTRDRQTHLLTQLFDQIRNETTSLMDEHFEYDFSIYSDPTVAAEERRRIFETLPMMAAHSSQIPDANSYITVALNSSTVLLTRQKDGSVGAFLNTCRHRGAQVVPAEESSGNRKNFTCPYHGWVYSNKGENKLIAYEETYGKSACKNFDLISLPVEERNGFIWVVENPNGKINVAEHLDKMDQALSEYQLEKWFFYKDHIFDFPQNWKIMMDGLIDGYHVEFLHGATISPYFITNNMAVEILGNHTLHATPRRTLIDYIDQNPAELDLEKELIIGNMITPNSMLVMHPHHIEYWTAYQDVNNPANSRIHLRYLTPHKELDQEKTRILEKNWKIATDAIINEDVPVGNSVQLSAKSNYCGKASLGRNEVLNQVFHRNYKRLMTE